MDCQGALAAAIVVAGAFYIVNGKLGGKIYSTTNYIKNRYGQKLSAYCVLYTLVVQLLYTLVVQLDIPPVL